MRRLAKAFATRTYKLRMLMKAHAKLQISSLTVLRSLAHALKPHELIPPLIMYFSVTQDNSDPQT